MSLAEAQAAFPAPEPGHVSPNSLYSAPLDLTPTTVIRNASLEAGSLPVVEEAATRRKKWEAQRRSWCLSTSEERRGTPLFAVKTHEEASVPFVAPTPKHVRLMGTATLTAERCSMSVSVPPPPSSPSRLTSSTTFPPPWKELMVQVKSPAPAMWPRRPWKRQRPEDEEWKTFKEDRCEACEGEGMGRLRDRGDRQG